MATFAKSLRNDDAKTRNRKNINRGLPILDENLAVPADVYGDLFQHLYVCGDVRVPILWAF